MDENGRKIWVSSEWANLNMASGQAIALENRQVLLIPLKLGCMSSAYLDHISVLSSYSCDWLRWKKLCPNWEELAAAFSFFLLLRLCSGTITEVENDSTAKKKERGWVNNHLSSPSSGLRARLHQDYCYCCGKEVIWATLVIMQKMAPFQQQFHLGTTRKSLLS